MALHFSAKPKPNADKDLQSARSESQRENDKVGLALVTDADKIFVIGGGELYALALPHADALVLTEIDTAFEAADTFFPAIDRAAFAEAARTEHVAADGTRSAFVTYRRRT